MPDADVRTDRFGCTLYEMMAREIPYNQWAPIKVMGQVATKGSALQLSPDWPAAMQHVIRQCLLVDPSQRPSMKIVHDMLQQHLEELARVHKQIQATPNAASNFSGSLSGSALSFGSESGAATGHPPTAIERPSTLAAAALSASIAGFGATSESLSRGLNTTTSGGADSLTPQYYNPQYTEINPSAPPPTSDTPATSNPEYSAFHSSATLLSDLLKKPESTASVGLMGLGGYGGSGGLSDLAAGSGLSSLTFDSYGSSLSAMLTATTNRPAPLQFDTGFDRSLAALNPSFSGAVSAPVKQTGLPFGVLAGGANGLAEGDGKTAQFRGCQSLAIDSYNRCFVADSLNGRIRSVSAFGVTSTLVVAPDGLAPIAVCLTPSVVGVDPSLIAAFSATKAGTAGQLIRYNLSDGESAVAACSLLFSNDNSLYAGKPTVLVSGVGADREPILVSPHAIAISHSRDGKDGGTVYIVDADRHRIMRVVLTRDGAASGAPTVFAGSISGSSDGACDKARFSYPRAIAITKDGTIFVAESSGTGIRRISGGTSRQSCAAAHVPRAFRS